MEISFLLECFIKITASVLCGALLGIERRSRNNIVGMRTLILICVSTTLLGILSVYIPENQTEKGFYGGDPTRIIAGVVSGIGFLGGGAILRQGLNIKGLTSAAIIWTASALGLTIGAGLYIQAFAVLFIILFLLVVLEKAESKWFPAAKSKTLHLMFETSKLDMSELRKIIVKHGFIICDLNLSRVESTDQTILHYTVKAPREEDYSKFEEELNQIGHLSEFSITD